MTWLELLKDAVAKEAARLNGKRGAIRNVAEMLGVSRSAVSAAVNEIYPGNTDRMAGRVLAKFGQGIVLCPHLKAELPIPDCVSWRKRPMPRSNPDALRHWQACRSCEIGMGVAKATPMPQPKPTEVA